MVPHSNCNFHSLNVPRVYKSKYGRLLYCVLIHYFIDFYYCRDYILRKIKMNENIKFTGLMIHCCESFSYIVHIHHFPLIYYLAAVSKTYCERKKNLYKLSYTFFSGNTT